MDIDYKYNNTQFTIAITTIEDNNKIDIVLYYYSNVSECYEVELNITIYNDLFKLNTTIEYIYKYIKLNF